MKVKPKSPLLAAIKAVVDAFSRPTKPPRMYEARPIKRTGPGTMPVYDQAGMTPAQLEEHIRKVSQEGKLHADVPFDLQ